MFCYATRREVNDALYNRTLLLTLNDATVEKLVEAPGRVAAAMLKLMGILIN